MSSKRNRNTKETENTYAYACLVFLRHGVITAWAETTKTKFRKNIGMKKFQKKKKNGPYGITDLKGVTTGCILPVGYSVLLPLIQTSLS